MNGDGAGQPLAVLRIANMRRRPIRPHRKVPRLCIVVPNIFADVPIAELHDAPMTQAMRAPGR